CSLDDDLAPGEAPPISIGALVMVAAYPQVVNSATVVTTTPDPDPSDNTSTDTVVVPPQVDLSITKSHAAPVVVGGTITYTVVVVNNGPTEDPGPVTVIDDLPAGLTPASVSAPGMACSISGQRVSCESASALAVGASLTVVIDAAVGPSAAPSVTNTAVVSTPSEELALTNNTATDTTEVTPTIGLGLTKTLLAQELGSATWQLTVSNTGLSATIEPIVVVDRLPPGLTYLSASGPGWTCANAANVVTCEYGGSIAAGASAPSIELTTTVSGAQGSTITNVATATGGGPGATAGSSASIVVPTFSLPSTGARIADVLRIAPLFLLLGLVFLLIGRRRRASA
ncbi:MAG: DUF11 domain-containing protein, partial [Ilumatobacteraceae bacterium]